MAWDIKFTLLPNSSTGFDYPYYGLVTSAIFEDVITLVLIVLVYVVGARRQGGLWTTDQVWARPQQYQYQQTYVSPQGQNIVLQNGSYYGAPPVQQYTQPQFQPQYGVQYNQQPQYGPQYAQPQAVPAKIDGAPHVTGQHPQ